MGKTLEEDLYKNIIFNPLSLHGVFHSTSSTHEYDLRRNLPITSILDSNSLNKISLSYANIIFCYKVGIEAIETFLEKKYSLFDGLTTSNCCHGMALLVRELILLLEEINLEKIKEEGKQHLQFFIENFSNNEKFDYWHIPEPLIDLICLFVLGIIRENCPEKGPRTITKKLKTVSPVGTKFCETIVGNLQKKISNCVADNYSYYLRKIKKSITVNAISVKKWGKYIQSNFIRTDRFGTKFASNIFSMQVLLAYLISAKAVIAIVNDLLDQEGRLRERFVCVLQGNGKDNFIEVTSEDLEELEKKSGMPVVVFGGCVYSNDLDNEKFFFQIEPWIKNFPGLVLACDIFYPQFPKSNLDPDFDSSPICPQEAEINFVFNKYEKTEGVSAQNPSLFCLAHIYTESLSQILKVLRDDNEDVLPISFLPNIKMSSSFPPIFSLES